MRGGRGTVAEKHSIRRAEEQRVEAESVSVRACCFSFLSASVVHVSDGEAFTCVNESEMHQKHPVAHARQREREGETLANCASLLAPLEATVSGPRR